MKKTIKCLKCKRSFETETDSSGIPYKKICPKCKKSQTTHGRGVYGINLSF
jgi:Zn finger protein HypA/HybF involved in hydrogenase expression